MKSKPNLQKKHLWAIPPILIMAIIFIFSQQNGDGSANLSGGLSDFLHLPEGLLRKLAHYILYFSLGLSWCFFFYKQSERKFLRLKTILIPVIFCIAYAALDEIHQKFIPNRDGNIHDVILDSMAAIAGISIVIAIYCRKKLKKS